METLTNFKPLERVVLPALGELECVGLTVIVGPNSSGKTQLLRDIHARLSGQSRDLVVAERIELRKPEFDPFIRSLAEAAFLETWVDDSGNTQIRPRMTHVGTQSGSGDIGENQLRKLQSRITDEQLLDARQPNEFLQYFCFATVTALFLENRLQLANEVGGFDYENAPPSNELHSLSLHDEAMAKLSQEIKHVFSIAVWLDFTRGAIFCIRVSDSPDIPSPEERLSRTKMAKYRTIDREGDGIKSYVATCISLLLGLRPVCLIDEPELCLHPPQAYNLGQFIGKFGASSQNATFVATHSSQTLRGVLQTAEKLQIVRLTRNAGSFQAHLVPSKILLDALERPTVRSETVLDGVFSQAVTVVEADGDRTVYQAAWETVSPEFQIDVHFAAVGGTGGFPDTCKLYRILRIPVAVIADLDIITDADQFKRVLSELTDDSIGEALCRRALDITNDIKAIPPNIDACTVRTELQASLEGDLDWLQEHDFGLREKLLRIAKKLDRMRRLKRGGVEAVPGEIRGRLEPLIDDCKQYGLFLVPVGELEEWLSEYNVGVSKERKWAWATAAAKLIRRVGKQDDDVWEFTSEVGTYLKSALETESLG